jgi:polo-like kinase 1
MHKNKIIHRDLKLGNLFLSDNMEIKIGDFGLATTIQYEGERKHTICGTPNYIAPEILESKTNGHSYEVDYWAIGVIVYTLLYGRPPFETEDVKETYKRIQNLDYAFPSHIYVSEEAKDLIKKTLILNAQDRMNVDAMRNHPFLTKTVLPKSLPNNTAYLPPNNKFYRKYHTENEPIKDVQDLSKLDKLETGDFKELKEFARKNVKEIKVNSVKLNEVKGDKRPLSPKERQRVNLNDISQCKEDHSLIKEKRGDVDINNIIFIENIVDYSSTFGILYYTNSNLLGVAFNDKTNLFKIIGSKEFHFEKNKQVKKFKNEIPPDLKPKIDILKNYEKYLNLNGGVQLKPNKKDIFVKKVIKTDISYIFKLSNRVIQVFLNII